MIEPLYFWKTVLLLGAGTFCIRFSIIAISSRIRISDRLRVVFSYIPAAVLPGFVAPAVFFHHGSLGLLLGKERFVILGLATVVCALTRSTLLTLGFGLLALFLLNLLG